MINFPYQLYVTVINNVSPNFAAFTREYYHTSMLEMTFKLQTHFHVRSHHESPYSSLQYS